MKRKICYLFIGVALCMITPMEGIVQNVDSKTERRMLRTGNEDYEKEKYTEAEVNYRRALDADPSSKMAAYNIGNALFRQGKYDEAARQYGDLTDKERPDDGKVESAGNWYNLGNSLYMQGKYAESIEAYKNSLRRNPDDHEARYNLRMAQLKLQQQQQQQQQQQNQDNQQQNQNNQQQNQQNQNNQQNRDNDKDKEKQQNSPQEQQNQNPQNSGRQEDRPADNGQPQPGEMSRENAQQILDAMQQDEKATQEKVQKALLEQRKKRKTDKEW